MIYEPVITSGRRILADHLIEVVQQVLLNIEVTQVLLCQLTLGNVGWQLLCHLSYELTLMVY